MTLRGITWDHPRGLDPLVAISERWQGGGAVQWTARSLASFEETPISQLAQEYDLIAIDHPFMGTVARNGAVRPLDALMRASLLDELKAASVGRSFESYLWGQRLWAVPIDAAAQVAAYRPDLVARAGQTLPARWEDVISFASSGCPVALAANPTHLFMSLITVCNSVAHGAPINADLTPAWWTDGYLDEAVAIEALEQLRAVLAVCHPVSWEANPIDIFERMAASDEIGYAPCIFGYSNYARPTASGRHRIAFGAVAGRSGGGVLGGVGLALSARCQDVDRAVAFLEHVCSEAVQKGPFFSAGGQPAHRAAWTSDTVNQICPEFFAATLASLDTSPIRPRTELFPAYQHQGGELLHSMVRKAGPSREAIRRLNGLWESMNQADVKA